MTFEQNLESFYFNKETLEMMVDEKMNIDEIIESMEMAGFEKNLSKFLINTNPVFYNSIMLRLKLYGKQKKEHSYVKNSLSKFENALPLVDYLFKNQEQSKVQTKVQSKVQTEVQSKVQSEEQVEEQTEEQTEEDKIQMLEENVESDIDSEDDEMSPLDKFYQEFIKKSKGSELKTKETYEVFTKWYLENFENETPDKKEFKNYLSEKIGKSGKKGWSDYALVV